MTSTSDARPGETKSIGAAPPSRATVLIALAIGLLVAWLFYGPWIHVSEATLAPEGDRRFVPFIAVSLSLAIASWAILPVNRAIAGFLDRVRSPKAIARRLATLSIGVGSAIAFYAIAIAEGRSLVPMWHDSNMHMVQAQLIAHGKLWAAPHPLADQMETFFVFTKPVYAAIHFPGTSLLYAPLLMLGVGPAVFSSMMAGAVVGLCYRVLCEIVDGVSGLLVVPLLFGVAQLRVLSNTLVSHHVGLVPILLSIWAYLHWRQRERGDLRWTCAIGAFVGFAAITRPLEALAYALPLALVMAKQLRGASLSRWVSTAVVGILCASPFLTLQLEFDHHVTGRWLQPPYERYNEVFHPGLAYAGAPAAMSAALIPTNLPQKVDYYERFIVAGVERYAAKGALAVLLTERLPLALAVLTPNPWIVAFWVLGLLGIVTRERRMLLAAAALYFAFCLPYALFLQHYPIAIAPLGVLLPTLGVSAIAHAFPGRRRSTEVLAVLALLALALAGIPGINPRVREPMFGWGPTNEYVNTRLPDEVHKPAIVLSRYRAWDQPFNPARDSPYDEPVYTIDALWPEQSPIARFQDLGPASNRAIYAFFADRHDDRAVYSLDRRLQRLVEIGHVSDLLANGEPSRYFTSDWPRPTSAGATQPTGE